MSMAMIPVVRTFENAPSSVFLMRPERVTILSGKVTVTIGGKATTFEAGGFYVNPPNEPHSLVFEEESVVQLTCEGPWIVELVR